MLKKFNDWIMKTRTEVVSPNCVCGHCKMQSNIPAWILRIHYFVGQGTAEVTQILFLPIVLIFAGIRSGWIGAMDSSRDAYIMTKRLRMTPEEIAVATAALREQIRNHPFASNPDDCDENLKVLEADDAEPAPDSAPDSAPVSRPRSRKVFH